MYFLSPNQFSHECCLGELENIYYANATHVMYVSANGGPSTVLFEATNAKLGYDPSTRRLFVYQPVPTSLHTYLLDGSDSQLAFNDGAINRYTVDDQVDKIYYIATTTDFTKSVNFDGSGRTTVLSGSNTDFSDIQIDSSKQ